MTDIMVDLNLTSQISAQERQEPEEDKLSERIFEQILKLAELKEGNKQIGRAW